MCTQSCLSTSYATYLTTAVSCLQVRDAVAVTIMGGDAALLRSPVDWERETVMDLLMEVLMMAMLAVRETLCVAAITARSLVFTSMRRMTAVT